MMRFILISTISVAFLLSLACAPAHENKAPSSKNKTPAAEVIDDTFAERQAQPTSTTPEKIVKQDELLKDMKELGLIEGHLEELGLKFSFDEFKNTLRWENTHFYERLDGEQDLQVVEDMIMQLERYVKSVDSFLKKYKEPFVLELNSGHLEHRQINKRSQKNLRARAQLSEQTRLFLVAWLEERQPQIPPKEL